jgi:hypothetical protein
VVAYIEDRDYRLPAVAADSFQNDRRQFIWHRHSIESYLVQPIVLLKAFQELEDSLTRLPRGAPAWATGIPKSISTVEDALRDAAKAIVSQEAGRILIERLWEDLRDSAGRVQKRVPDVLTTHDSKSADDCRQCVLSEVTRLLEAAKTVGVCPQLNLRTIETRYTELETQYAAEEYMNSLRFLEDFDGKRLMGRIQSWLQANGVQLRRKRLLKMCADAAVSVYDNDRTVFGMDEFLSLANGVRRLGGLPPIT